MNWKSDIDQLADNLPKLHKKFFHNISEKEFYERVEKLKLLEKDMNVYSMVVGLSKLIALAGDAHTSLEIPKNNMLPIKCYWFEEGIYITSTMTKFGEVLHKKIIEIEGVPIVEVIEKLTEMISHENIQFVKSQLPELLVCTDILYGLGIAVQVEQVVLKTEHQDGGNANITLPVIKYREWQNMVSVKVKSDISLKLPLYRKNGGLYYWEEEIEEGKFFM